MNKEDEVCLYIADIFLHDTFERFKCLEGQYYSEEEFTAIKPYFDKTEKIRNEDLSNEELIELLRKEDDDCVVDFIYAMIWLNNRESA